MNGQRRPRRVRYVPTAQTLKLAMHNIAKPPAAAIDEVLAVTHVAAKAMREGVATRHQWELLAGMHELANVIEKQGIVTGLHEHLASAGAALDAIYARANTSDGWRPTALHFYELDAINTLLKLHEFQLKQLGRSEYFNAVDTAVKQNNRLSLQVTVHQASGVAA